MNEGEMFVKTKELEKKPDPQEEVKTGEAEEGTKALEEMGKLMNLKANTESLVDSINNNPEAIVSKAEKNEKTKSKLKTFVGVIGTLGGLGIAVRGISNAEEIALFLRESMIVGGVAFASAIATLTKLQDKFLKIELSKKNPTTQKSTE